jgi:hypothetical protein
LVTRDHLKSNDFREEKGFQDGDGNGWFCIILRGRGDLG